MKNLKNIGYFGITLLTLGACLELNEIPFVALKADFVADPDLVQLGNPIRFRQNSTLVAQQFLWDFGDGNTSQEANPAYTYSATGFYEVKMIASKADGFTKDSLRRTVLVLPPTEIAPNRNGLQNPSHDEIGQSFEVLSNGLILAGSRDLNKLRIIRTDFNLNPIWTRTISNLAGGSGALFCKEIKPTTDGGFIMVGHFRYNPLERDAFVLKLDASGNELWRVLSATSRDERYNFVEELSDEYFVGGTIAEINNGQPGPPFIVADVFDQDGVLQFSLQQGNNWQAEDMLFTNDGLFAVAATQGRNPKIFLYDSELKDFLGSLPFGPLLLNNLAFEGQAKALTQLRSGGFALVGQADYGGDSTHAFIAQINSFGDQVWIDQRAYFHESFEDVGELSNGALIAVGIHENPISGKDILVCKYSPLEGTSQSASRTLLGIKLIGRVNQRNDQAFKLEILDNDDILLFGSTQNTFSDLQDFYFLRLDRDLNVLSE
ncbi:MAG: PKD domain-containing protein [Microscillaceae bacterium]|nr:PKD domain-containing protein [Microscillaceae bacterium]